MEKYIPKALDTSAIVISEDLALLAEEMAKNVHDVWAESRIREGWTYGPERDDAKKTHPCLVPYEQLPEIEKEYDRATSRETLKFIIASGFAIIPPSNPCSQTS